MAKVKKAEKTVKKKVKDAKPAKKVKGKIKIDEATAKKAVPKKNKVSEAVKHAVFRPNYQHIMRVVEKKFKLSTNMNDRFEFAISSGLLVQDLILGGGYISGGMYTNAGGEQSAKSTNTMNFVGYLLDLPEDDQPGLIVVIDAEGSTDPIYLKNMRWADWDVGEVFGVQDKNGEYMIAPRIQYYPENRGEQILDTLNGILQRLPDMELLDGQWYYVYENKKETQKELKGLYDSKLFSKFNKFYVKAPSGAPQAVIVVDSWISLVPENVDDEEKGEGLAASARMFSQHLPKIKGKLRRKNAILMGVNQLREKPMAKGDPRYEPGGQALRFQSDVRIWQTARAVPHASGPVEEEPSVTDDGVDIYMYKHFKAHKNKLSTPGLEGWARIWVSDADGIARGFCPAYDVFQYLKMTGQVTGSMKKLEVKLESGLTFKGSFLDIKRLVLFEGKDKKAFCEELGIKNVNLWELCRKQIKSGKGKELMFNFRKGKAAADEDEDEGDDD